MVRVQIRLPDDIHVRAKRLAAAKEISFAELVRRGLELVLAQAPPPEEIGMGWDTPTVYGMGYRPGT